MGLIGLIILLALWGL